MFVPQLYIKIISGDVDDLEQATVKIYCESSIDNPYIIEIEKTSDLERFYNTIINVIAGVKRQKTFNEYG